jgi:hypothetical protein
VSAGYGGAQRECNVRFRKPLLYPAELRDHRSHRRDNLAASAASLKSRRAGVKAIAYVLPRVAGPQSMLVRRVPASTDAQDYCGNRERDFRPRRSAAWVTVPEPGILQ